MAEPSPVARLTVSEALRKLGAAGGEDSVLLYEHGTLRVKLYAPRGSDDQSPHRQDEVYVVASGTGQFFDGERRQPFEPGTFLFAAAGRPHRFENFSDDFSVWVFFYGPDGGEVPQRRA